MRNDIASASEPVESKLLGALADCPHPNVRMEWGPTAPEAFCVRCGEPIEICASCWSARGHLIDCPEPERLRTLEKQRRRRR